MQELIDRLEKATGPDRAIDYALQAKFQPQKKVFERPLFYTASIDAALTLVPDGADIDISTGPNKPWAQCHGSVSGVVGDVVWAATPAIAICIATLKARQQMSSQR